MTRRTMTIAFDGDDTLWHNEDVYWSIETQFRELLANHLPAEEVSSRLFAIEMRNLALFGYGAKGFVLSMIETAIEISNGQISAAEIGQVLNFLREMLERPIRLMDGVAETLEELSRSYQLILLTKGELFDQESKIARSGLANYFGLIRIVSEKNVETYTALAQSCSISHNDLVMVGNSLRSDILPVVEFGAHAIHIPYHLTWKHERIGEIPSASHLYRRAATISEVPAIIQSIDPEPHVRKQTPSF